jgi:hypothetical protein
LSAVDSVTGDAPRDIQNNNEQEGYSNLLASLIQPIERAEKPDTRTKLEKIADDTNLPLLKMGLTMMASDKPLFEAIGQGGLAGVGQLQAERKAQAEAEAAEAKNLADLQKSRQELAVDMLKAENLSKYRDSMLDINQQRADAYEKAVSAQANRVPAENKAAMQALLTQYRSLSNRLASSFDANEKMALADELAQIKSALDSIAGTGLNATEGVLSPPPMAEGSDQAGQDDFDFSKYQKQFAQ